MSVLLGRIIGPLSERRTSANASGDVAAQAGVAQLVPTVEGRLGQFCTAGIGQHDQRHQPERKPRQRREPKDRAQRLAGRGQRHTHQEQRGNVLTQASPSLRPAARSSLRMNFLAVLNLNGRVHNFLMLRQPLANHGWRQFPVMRHQADGTRIV